MFFEILKDSLKLMKKNPNLTQFIFILFIIVTLFLPVLAGVKMNIKVIPMLIVFFIFLCAFFSGMFFAFKKAMDYEQEPKKDDNPIEFSPLYFAEFFQGVGKYTAKFIYSGLFLLIILVALSYSYQYLINHYLVIPDKVYGFANPDILANEAKMMEYISGFTPAEQSQVGKLSLLTVAVMILYGYLTMIYPAILVIKENNFFKSFFVSLKYLFRNFPVSFLIFLFFNFVLTIVNLLSVTTANNLIISIIVILLQCYLNVWYILSLFVYYEKVK